jgi:hypothetical protein
MLQPTIPQAYAISLLKGSFAAGIYRKMRNIFGWNADLKDRKSNIFAVNHKP